MVSCSRDLRSLSILGCTGPYHSSMSTSKRLHNGIRTTLPWRRATGASRRREHGPYFTKTSAGVLRRSHGVKEKTVRSDGAAHPRPVIAHRPLKCWSREKLWHRSGERGHRLSSGRTCTSTFVLMYTCHITAGVSKKK